MVPIARRNLLREKGRLVVSCVGVGAAVVLIAVVAGIYDGFHEIATTYIEESGADLIVAQEGSTDLFHSFSILPLNLSDSIASIPGVVSVSPLILRLVEVHSGESHSRAAVIGFQDLGGPWHTIKGTKNIVPGEIVLDEIFANRNGLNVGSTVQINGKNFTVAGISTGTNVFIQQYAFVTFGDASGLVLPPGMTNYFFVRISEQAISSEISDRIQSVSPGLTVFTNKELASSNSNFINDAFLPILLVLDFVGVLVGVMVIGLTVYTATIEKTKEYGILKAIGATNGQLFKVLLSQSMILSGLGFLAGVAITAILTFVIGYFAPSVVVSISLNLLVLVLGATLTMGFVASYVPLRRVAHINPAVVFRRG